MMVSAIDSAINCISAFLKGKLSREEFGWRDNLLDEGVDSPDFGGSQGETHPRSAGVVG